MVKIREQQKYTNRRIQLQTTLGKDQNIWWANSQDERQQIVRQDLKYSEEQYSGYETINETMEDLLQLNISEKDVSNTKHYRETIRQQKIEQTHKE